MKKNRRKFKRTNYDFFVQRALQFLFLIFFASVQLHWLWGNIGLWLSDDDGGIGTHYDLCTNTHTNACARALSKCKKSEQNLSEEWSSARSEAMEQATKRAMVKYNVMKIVFGLCLIGIMYNIVCVCVWLCTEIWRDLLRVRTLPMGKQTMAFVLFPWKSAVIVGRLGFAKFPSFSYLSFAVANLSVASDAKLLYY